MSNEEKDIRVLQIDPLIKGTFNKIAEWHNNDATKESLKLLSIELINDIAGAVFTHIGLEYKEAIHMDEKTKTMVDKVKSEL
jgi:hypothetical protein